MTFRDIAKKNLTFNIRKFASFFLVNAFVVCVLFLFGSLLFNDILNADPGIRAAGSLIVMAAVGITVFSVIFLMYTGFYFIRSRGREFGVYLTLGMTSRDLSRMVTLESSAVFGLAAALGMGAALLIGKLFYLALAKVLEVSDNLFFIGYETFLFSLGVLAFIFLFQRLAAARFIRRMSIVEITKSSKTKDTSKQSPFIGIVSLIMFATSIFMFHAITTGATWAINFLREYMELSVIVVIATMLVSLFFLIGSAIAGVTWIFKRFPAVYQRNILLLSSLSHKFKAYRVSLFSVTLLVGFAVFFIGIGMSFYTYGEMTIDTFQPHDFMVERRGEINIITEGELMEIVNSADGKIEQIKIMPYLDGMVYRELNDRDGLFVNFRQNSYLVSESDFNRFTGLDINLAPDELLIVTNDEDAAKEGMNFDTTIVIESFAQGIERSESFRQKDLNKDAFMESLDDADVLEYSQRKSTLLFQPFVNSNGSLEFIRSHANVIDDEVYRNLTRGQTNELIVFELASGNHQAVLDGLLTFLREKNNISSEVWRDTVEFSITNKDNINGLRPLCKTERHEILLRANGFLLFAMAFLGLLFLASSCIVLYYKIVADTDEEMETISMFKKIGLTDRECRSYLQNHTAIIFFLPLLLGGALGLYLTYQFFSAGTSHAGYLISHVVIMYGVIVVFGILLYASLRKRFFKDVGV